MHVSELLKLYDDEVRRRLADLPPGFRGEWDGPVLRLVGPDPEPSSNGVVWSGLDPGTADEAIARQIAFFSSLGHAFEWKHFDYDGPADLAARLEAAGFEAQDPETLVAFETGQGFPLPTDDGSVEIRRIEDPAGFDVIPRVNGAVYGDLTHAGWLARVIADEKRAEPDAISVYAAFAGGEPVSVGWMRHRRGDAFGSLWGGATLPEHRGRGVYSRLVAARVAEARDRGCRWLTVDCSPMSLPILEKRGFRRLAVTTPYFWSGPRTST